MADLVLEPGVSEAQTAAAATAPTARRLRGWVRAARRTSGTARPIGETLGNLYVAVLGVVIGAALVEPVAAGALGDVGTRSTGAAHPALAVALAVAGLLAAAASGARALALLGPVVRDPADVTWLLASPVDRRGMLVPSAALLLGVVTAAGAAVGALAGVLAHAVLAWTVAGAAAGLAVTAGAIVLQSRRAAHVVGPVADVLTLVAVGLLVSALLGVDLRDHGATRGTGTAAAAATVLAAVVLLALVPRRLSRLRRSDLVAGAGLALGLRATVTALDGSFLAETLRTRRLLQRGARGPARAIPLRGKGLGALIAADAVRVLRAPDRCCSPSAPPPRCGWSACSTAACSPSPQRRCSAGRPPAPRRPACGR
ncbi:hypothetical protein GCM10025868_38130 [Angustibacter aerolatus]|uniref:ABC-2 type transporter domain-containing protein n=1 Tax=Angustibacter aerolatus TaxID=1162965 RepID=A0ABQ6JMF9_9ACTN|nr:hypothetical protein GCM10025868_38130 [Angustibacter aerolatus]